jgi:uncharacterized protein YecE (DUF72 family)
MAYIGCSGWSYSAWRGRFYPEELPARRWFEHYAATFDAVELNNTFYRLPTPTAVEGWHDAAPNGFGFGPTLVQMPPRWSRNVWRLDEMLSVAPADLEWAVEFRESSWLRDDVFEVLERYGAALC